MGTQWAPPPTMKKCWGAHSCTGLIWGTVAAVILKVQWYVISGISQLPVLCLCPFLMLPESWRGRWRSHWSLSALFPYSQHFNWLWTCLTTACCRNKSPWWRQHWSVYINMTVQEAVWPLVLFIQEMVVCFPRTNDLPATSPWQSLL